MICSGCFGGVGCVCGGQFPAAAGLVSGCSGYGCMGQSDELGTDEEAQPVDVARDSNFWASILGETFKAIPTALEKGITAYKTYDTTDDWNATLKSILVTGPQNVQKPPTTGLQVQQQVSAAPWYQNPAYVVGGLAIVGLLAFALTRK